jgi:hypothetical protein
MPAGQNRVVMPRTLGTHPTIGLAQNTGIGRVVPAEAFDDQHMGPVDDHSDGSGDQHVHEHDGSLGPHARLVDGDRERHTT